MRPKRTLSNMRPGPLALGALMFATPASAVALAAGQPETQSAIRIRLSATHVPFGGTERVTGTTSQTSAGQVVSLQFAAGRNSSWRSLTSTRVGRDGHFSFAI